MNIEYELRDKYLYSQILMDISISNVENIFLNILEEAKKHDLNKILIDIRKVKFLVNILNRFDIGKFMAEKARMDFKIAALADKEHLKEAFVETVARNRGLNFFAFLDEKEAVDWLLK